MNESTLSANPGAMSEIFRRASFDRLRPSESGDRGPGKTLCPLSSQTIRSICADYLSSTWIASGVSRVSAPHLPPWLGLGFHQKFEAPPLAWVPADFQAPLRLTVKKKKKGPRQILGSRKPSPNFIGNSEVRNVFPPVSGYPNAHLTNSNHPPHLFSPISSATRGRDSHRPLRQCATFPVSLLPSSKFARQKAPSPSGGEDIGLYGMVRQRVDIYPRGRFK